MKCTFTKIRTIELENNKIGARVEGFIPMDDVSIIPNEVLEWIYSYTGVTARVYADGIAIISWGETTCSHNDTYNKKQGEHLAESKAKTKLYRFIANYTSAMTNYFVGLVEMFNNDAMKYAHCLEHEIEHTKFLSE